MADLSPSLSPATVAVTAGRPPHEPDQPLNVPISMASTFVAGGDREYGRYGNPTWSAFEDALGELEGGRCLAYSSGMAAVTTILDLVGHAATVVAPRHAYQGSIMSLADLEARGRITAHLVDIEDTAEKHGIVGYDTDATSVDSRERSDNVFCPFRFDLEKFAPVDQ